MTLGSVKAHNFLLSLISPIFRQKLSTHEDSSLQTIEIKGFSLESVNTMIKLLYSGDRTLMSKLSSLESLFQLVLLGEEYELRGCRTMIQERVEQVNISDYYDVFQVLKKYEDRFTVECVWSILYKRTVSVLQRSCRSEKDVLALVEVFYIYIDYCSSDHS